MLVVAFAIFVLSSVLTGMFGRRDAGTVDDVMRFTGPFIGIGFGVSGLGALTFSLWALIVQRERSSVVWGALAFGLFVATFLLGEVLIPH
jgi:hypothetical protein